MRLAFWILLLANLVLLVWAHGYFSSAEEGREPERLTRQIHPEKLRIQPNGAAATTPESKATPTCTRLAGLTPAEADSLAKALAGRTGWQVSIGTEELPAMHWVAIVGLPSRAVAEKKRDEIRLMGIGDMQIVEHEVHGPFAVSLAMLPNESAANERLQNLQRKGVRSARILLLKQATRNAVELQAPANALTQKLPELVALFPSASVGDCTSP